MAALTQTAISMHIESEDIGPGLRHIVLAGRMDVAGTELIASRFSALTAQPQRVVLDLRQVDFLASIGIHAIISNARAQVERGGRMVLLVGANAAVTKALHVTGIDALLPLHANLAEATQAALA